MIGQLGELSLDVIILAPMYEQLIWVQANEFARLRDEANRLLSKMGVHAQIPDTQEVYLHERESIDRQILERLGNERQRILGDTVALPMFLLFSKAFRSAIKAPFGEDWQWERNIIEQCIDDLGIPDSTITHLEREIGWVFVRTEESDEPTISRADAIRAGFSFVHSVWEEFFKKEDSIQGNRQMIEQLRAIGSEVHEFHTEYRQHAHRLAELLEERNADIVSLVDDIRKRLISAGIGEDEAAEMTVNNPKGLWDRISLWAGDANWANAAEEALWAALDFIPAGTTVKLGIKVTRAVRKALKKN